MTKQAAYDLGVKLALEDAGLVKKSAKDPVVPKPVRIPQVDRSGQTTA